MKSIRRNLQRTLFGGFVIFIVLLWISVGYAIPWLLERYSENRLEQDAKAALSAVYFDQGQIRVNPELLDAPFLIDLSGRYLLLQKGEQVWRSPSLKGVSIQLPDKPMGKHNDRMETIVGPNEQQLFAYQGVFEFEGGPLLVTVTENITRAQSDTRRLQWIFAVVFSLLLSLGLWLQRWVLNRSLQPLDKMREEVRDLQQGDLSQLSAPEVRELSGVVKEVNYLNTSRQQQIDRYRKANGNLSHALKIPLSLIRQSVQQLRLGEAGQALDIIDEQELRIEQLIQRELKRARIAGAASTGKHVELRRLLDRLAAVLHKIYPEKQLQFIQQVPEGFSLAMEPEDATELFGNLLDNSWKWATSKVVCSAEQMQGGVRIVIGDDGEGCTSEQLALLPLRGERLDEQVGGSGLGLSIVGDIVQIYELQLAYQISPLGGLEVSIQSEPH